MQPKEIPLNLGLKVTTTIRGDKFDLCVRGWRPMQYIITDGPMVGTEPLRLAEQTGCSVQYIREGVFVNFATTVVFIIASVYPLMVLEYPRRFESHNLRKNSRYKTETPASYLVEGNLTGREASATLRDISMCGALMTHSSSLVKKNKIALHARMNDADLSIDCEVQTVRQNPKNLKEPFVTGIKFLNIGDAQRSALQKFIENVVMAKPVR